MTSIARQERAALCDTFTRVGPLAPTLCGDWTTAELAAHLVIRERRPLDAAGVVIPALAERADAAVRTMARETPWAELVDQVRLGPPKWHPTRFERVDEAANTIELAVHHEDVLRAGDLPRRTVGDDLQAAVWKRLVAMAPVLLRSAPAGIVLVTDHARRAVRPATARGAVALRGRPLELALYCYGRQSVADVELDGPEPARQAIEAASLGL